MDTYTILIVRAVPLEKELSEYGYHYNGNDLPYDQFDLDGSIKKILRRPRPPAHSPVFEKYNTLLEIDLLRVQAIHIMRTLVRDPEYLPEVCLDEDLSIRLN